MYKPINGYTRESIIETLKKYLPRDGSACVDKNNTCIYGRLDGARCAAGAFLPDNHILLNGKLYGSISDPGTQSVLFLHPVSWPLENKAMQQLQSAHDRSNGFYTHTLDQCIRWVITNVEETN